MGNFLTRVLPDVVATLCVIWIVVMSVIGTTTVFEFFWPSEPQGTSEQLCVSYFSEWQALENCKNGANCRLNDKQFKRWQKTAIEAMRYCGMRGIEEGEADKDVQPQHDSNAGAARKPEWQT